MLLKEMVIIFGVILLSQSLKWERYRILLMILGKQGEIELHPLMTLVGVDNVLLEIVNVIKDYILLMIYFIPSGLEHSPPHAFPF